MSVLSRLEAGKLHFQPASIDLNLFCHGIADEVQSATNRRCPIELNLNSVPTEAQDDEQLLGHILTNLLINAVKYSEPDARVYLKWNGTGGTRYAWCAIRGLAFPKRIS